MKKLCVSLVVLLFAVAAVAAGRPYDEAADAKQDIRQALAQAEANKTPVILVFGANWCGDCQMLERAMESGASAPLLSRDFRIVKINIGKFDTNLDIASSYGVPIKKGIPAVVILSSKNEVLYATREGELADAGKMGDDGIYQFFKKVTASVAARK